MERIQEITYWLTAWLDDSVQTEKDPCFPGFSATGYKSGRFRKHVEEVPESEEDSFLPPDM